MSREIRTETETVIKRILPYLMRRGYVIETDLDFETSVRTTDRYTRGYVDIVVTCGKTKPQFLIEAKRSSKSLSDADKKQALTYAKSLDVPFVVVTNGYKVQLFNSYSGLPLIFDGVIAEKIPTPSQLAIVLKALRKNPQVLNIDLRSDSSLPFRPGLPLKQINALFQRCHNQIRKIEKDEDHVFSDFSKLLFLKLLEEKADYSEFTLPYTYRFHELAARQDNVSDQVKHAVEKMIDDIKNQTTYGDVLEGPIYLSQAKTFHYLVRELANVSFCDSNLDSKGAAFEYFVRATLKGKKLGQYFTPRPLVELMIAIVGEKKVLNSVLAGTQIKVIDPACGTGGFLVFQMQGALAQLEQELQSDQITQSTYDEKIVQLRCNTFYGADANKGVACAAKMNMIIAGDGHSNIAAEDTLRRNAKLWSIDTPDCDLVLTNPPFGTSETDSLIPTDLSQFPILITKGQHLFLQKIVRCLKSGGQACTVIDEGLLNTESSVELRKWLLKNCELRAIISLPDETFKPNKINVKSSVMLLRRRQTEDTDLSHRYPVTFIKIASLGYESSGEPIRNFDLALLKREVAQRVQNSHVGETFSGYEWHAFTVDSSQIANDDAVRFDFKYWQPGIISELERMKNDGALTLGAINLIETRRGKSPSSESYVDQQEGYALVVKAGSNITKFGEVNETGDYIEKNVYDDPTFLGARILPGDVLLSSTGDGTLGKCGVFRSSIPAIADGHVTIIRVNQDLIHPEYLCDYLRMGFGQNQIVRLYTGSTGLIELTPDAVKKILVECSLAKEDQIRISGTVRSAEQNYQSRIYSALQDLQEARREFLGGAPILVATEDSPTIQ